ncbi:MAG: MobA/MobL family protein [Anaerovoracaceae bacterium]
MSRNIFIRQTKLHNVRGRITYITSTAKQENLYAVYETADRAFWKRLAEQNREDFARSGTNGSCIEARELIIALPESYIKYDPHELLKEHVEFFKRRYGVECAAALHHNKSKTNYHIHLIFSERKMLDVPIRKTAPRNMFYDESGRKCRTKKEITDESGQIRKGCSIIKKGEIYEEKFFDKKIKKFKEKSFLEEIKAAYAEFINENIKDDNEKLTVFNRDGIYLPMRKIGKNNPNENKIKANNRAVIKWNRTAAQISGRMPTEHIREIKREEIEKPLKEVRRSGEYIGDSYEKTVNRAAATLFRFYNRWIMLSEEVRSKPGEDFFFRLLDKCRAKVKSRSERDWER